MPSPISPTYTDKLKLMRTFSFQITEAEFRSVERMMDDLDIKSISDITMKGLSLIGNIIELSKDGDVHVFMGNQITNQIRQLPLNLKMVVRASEDNMVIPFRKRGD